MRLLKYNISKKVYPHITTSKNICGGSAVISGTRIPVWSIIALYKSGLSIEEIIKEFPYVPPAKIYSAFLYYSENKQEIEKEIKENMDETKWKKLTDKFSKKNK
jgi:uncharacterized protein (DUF433 family)